MDNREHDDDLERRDDFGPLTQRQAENLADFAIRRGESQQFEKLGRALAAKIIYLAGACLLAFWYFLGDKVKAAMVLMLS